MPTLTFEGKTFSCEPNETVLTSLHRQGVEIPSSCRNGICQTCLLRAVSGTPPTSAQAGLKDTLRAQGYFLACLCKPQEDLAVALPDSGVVTKVPARVVCREYLNREILRLVLQCQEPFAFRPGQFIHLYREDGLIRSYSVAGLPQEDGLLELHVRRLPDGAMSGWLHEKVAPGDVLQVAGPSGNCFYLPDGPDRKMLLIGTGSGLAPLWGIVQDALAQGHTGEIRLYHGSWEPSGLYLVSELQELAARYSNFHYIPCVDAEAEASHREGRADLIALSEVSDLRGWRLYLCGHPGMVQNAKKRAYLAGASLRDIYADPFVLSAPPG